MEVRARLQSLTLPHVGNWLNVAHILSLRLHLRPQEFVMATKYRLGLPLYREVEVEGEGPATCPGHCFPAHGGGELRGLGGRCYPGGATAGGLPCQADWEGRGGGSVPYLGASGDNSPESEWTDSGQQATLPHSPHNRLITVILLFGTILKTILKLDFKVWNLIFCISFTV